MAPVTTFSTGRRVPFARSSSRGGGSFSLGIQPGRETKCDLPDHDSLLTSMGRPRSDMQADTVSMQVNYARRLSSVEIL